MQISIRELQVLQLIANECTTGEIANELYISYDTVKTHRRHLLDKLQVKNVAGLIRKGFEFGYLTIPSHSITSK